MLIDSYGWIEYFTDGPLAEKYAKYIEADDQGVLIPALVIYEVYKRIKILAGGERALAAFAQLKTYATVDFDDALALSAADCSIAYKLGMADAIIYASAKKFGAKVISSDPYFKGLEGVIFIE